MRNFSIWNKLGSLRDLTAWQYLGPDITNWEDSQTGFDFSSREPGQDTVKIRSRYGQDTWGTGELHPANHIQQDKRTTLS